MLLKTFLKITSVNLVLIKNGMHLSSLQFASVKRAQKENLVNELCEKYGNLPKFTPELIGNRINLKFSSSHWTQFIDTLLSFDFKIKDCFQIINAEPQVLTILKPQLETVLDRWMKTTLGAEFVHFLILNQPRFLFIPPAFIDKRMHLMRKIAHKPKQQILLLMQCPNLMTEQWNQIEQKLDYLYNTMRVDSPEVLRSFALAKSLDHIKLRHTLLERCGLYVTPSQYEHKRVNNDKSSFRNPALKRIVDNEDNAFARKICKISTEEYSTFKLLYEEELNKDNDSERNSDSDDDSDSDES